MERECFQKSVDTGLRFHFHPQPTGHFPIRFAVHEVRPALMERQQTEVHRCRDLSWREDIHRTGSGECLLAKTDRGICALRFVAAPLKRVALRELQSEWENARLVEDENETGVLCRQIFENTHAPFHLHLRGTNFQLKVWQALLTIPSGSLTNYGDL